MLDACLLEGFPDLGLSIRSRLKAERDNIVLDIELLDNVRHLLTVFVSHIRLADHGGGSNLDFRKNNLLLQSLDILGDVVHPTRQDADDLIVRLEVRTAEDLIDLLLIDKLTVEVSSDPSQVLLAHGRRQRRDVLLESLIFGFPELPFL